MKVQGFVSKTTIKVTIDGADFIIPDDLSNCDRQMLAAWEEEGNVIRPYVEPPTPFPLEISDRILPAVGDRRSHYRG